MAEEGELVLTNEEVPPKQQKVAKGNGKASLVASKEHRNMVEVHLQNPA